MIPPTRAVLEEHRGQPTREAMWGMIPSTRAALEEHVKRAAYQGGHVWGMIQPTRVTSTNKLGLDPE